MTSSLKLFLNLYYIKQIDSKLPCVCSVIDHRWRQNVVRTSVTHSAAPRVPLFCSYHILTLSVIYYWTHARQLGIYLLNTKWPKHAMFRPFTCSYVLVWTWNSCCAVSCIKRLWSCLIWTESTIMLLYVFPLCYPSVIVFKPNTIISN